jgi:PH-interacting protein
LVLRIPRRDLKIQFPSVVPLEPGGSSASKAELPIDGVQNATSSFSVHINSTIKWGEVKLRSSKRCKFEDSAGEMQPSSDNAVSHDVDESGSKKELHEYGNDTQQTVEQSLQKSQQAICLDSIHENHDSDVYIEGNLPGEERITNGSNTHVEEVNNKECNQQFHSTSQPTFTPKLVSSGDFADGASSPAKSKAAAVGSNMNSVFHQVSMQHCEDSTTDQHRSSDLLSPSRNYRECTDKSTGLHDSKRLHFESSKTYGAVYKRTKPSKHRKNLDSDSYVNGDSTSVSKDDGGYQPPDYSPTTTGTGSLRRSARRSCTYTDDGRARDAISHVKNSSHEASTSGRRIFTVERDWGSTSKTASLRSTRNKREGCNSHDTHLVEKRHQVSLNCWLMLLEHEDIYRYIPQHGDEVMYLRQVMLYFVVFYDLKQL